MGTYTNTPSVDQNGQLQSWTPAEPIKMTCEYGNCNSNQGQDYKRKNEKGPWADEPIFLCDEHSKGYEKFGSKNKSILKIWGEVLFEVLFK